MTTHNTPPNGDESLEHRVQALEAQLAEAKARIRRLESGGSTTTDVVVDQYDRPLVTYLENNPQTFIGIDSVKGHYQRAGVTDNDKVRRRLKALRGQGIIERRSLSGRYMWTLATEDDAE